MSRTSASLLTVLLAAGPVLATPPSEVPPSVTFGADKATLQVTVPSSHKVAATGLDAGSTANPDGTVTLSLSAPQATSVILTWQNMSGKAPTGDPYPMTKDANGVWSITMGPNSKRTRPWYV